MKALHLIQQELKAPKDLHNSFGGYKYRSCESILEAVKPLLAKHEATLTITDDVVAVGERVFVKATATLTYTDESGPLTTQVSAFAREPEVKKGMDPSQITGAASSYARKYALNGLFLIDDTKDADATNKHDEEPPVASQPASDVKPPQRRVIDALNAAEKWQDAEIVKPLSRAGDTLEIIAVDGDTKFLEKTMDYIGADLEEGDKAQQYLEAACEVAYKVANGEVSS